MVISSRDNYVQWRPTACFVLMHKQRKIYIDITIGVWCFDAIITLNMTNKPHCKALYKLFIWFYWCWIFQKIFIRSLHNLGMAGGNSLMPYQCVFLMQCAISLCQKGNQNEFSWVVFPVKLWNFLWYYMWKC